MEEWGEHAHVQYDDWLGTVAADEQGHDRIEALLGLDPEEWRVIGIDVFIAEGFHEVDALVLPAGTGYDDLAAEAAAGRSIPLTRVTVFSSASSVLPEAKGGQAPVTEALELLTTAFNRLSIRFRTAHFPPGATFHVAKDIPEDSE